MKRRALAAALVLAFALALSACGDGGEETSGAPAQGQSADATAPATPPQQGEDASGNGDSGKAAEDEPGQESGAGESFTPKPHTDSGGGSEQFEVKGGDNSVQEYGAEAEGSEFEQVAAALHGFLDARVAEEWAAACSYLAPSVVASAEQAAQAKGGDGCATGLQALTNPAGMAELRAEAAQADVGSVRVEGESGFVIYRVGETPYALAIAREGEEWKVAALGGYPLR